MFFEFRFWHYLTKSQELANNLRTSSMRGFNKRIFLVIVFGVCLFFVREIWGMNTESMTSLLVTMSTIDFTIARIASLVGEIIWSFIYMTFHLFGIAYLLSMITKIPFKQLIPIQLLVTALLLFEKALILLVFFMRGETANVSFLSFGPLAVTFLENEYLIYFLNQLTITTALIIALQLSFIRTYNEISNRKHILFILIALHLIMALLTAAIGFIPMDKVLSLLVAGGGIHE